MKLSKKTKKAGALVGTFSALITVLVIILPGLLQSSIVEPIYPDEHLFVDATYLLIEEEKNDSVNITCDIYLTNIWKKDSGDIKAIAYVIEQTNNFAVYKTRVEIGVINADSTNEVEIPVVLSNSSYKVEILLFENDKIVTKGKISIIARAKYSELDLDSGLNQEWTVTSGSSYFENIRVTH